MPTIEINMTAQQANRLADAWEKQFGARPSLADVKQHLVRELRSIVQLQERRDAEAQISVSQFDPE